jgi:hypothetical protein
MAADREWLERVLKGLGDAMDADGLRRALLRRGATREEVEDIFAVLAARVTARAGAAPPAPAGALEEAPGQVVAADPSTT